MAFSIDKYHFKTGSFFDNLPPAEQKLLKSNIINYEEKKGKVLFREDAYSNGVYILKKGKVKICQYNKDGKEQIVYIYCKGEIMGYRSLLCGEPNPVTAIALEDCTISFIHRKYFLQLLDQSPALSKKLLVNLSYEFSVWANIMAAFMQLPAQERVALTLLILNEKYKKDNNNSRAVINLSRDNIASYAGTTVETLVRMLRHFKDEKIIKTEGRRIIILNPQALEKITELY